MKKKKGMVFVLCLVALVILLGVEILLNQISREAEERETEETEEVNPLNIDTDDLESVTVTNRYGTFSMVKKGDTWENAEDVGFPLKESEWTGKLSYLNGLTAERTLNEPADLAEYGLLEPSVQLDLKLENGEEHQVCIGDQNPSTYDYYLYVDTAETVYTVSSSLANAMSCKLYDLAEGEAFPDISSGTLTHVRIKSGDTFLEFQNSDGEDSYSVSWTVSWDGESAVKADSSAMSSLTGTLSALDYEDFVDYKGENLEQYGLGEPWAEIVWDYQLTETVAAEAENQKAEAAEAENQEAEAAEAENREAEAAETESQEAEAAEAENQEAEAAEADEPEAETGESGQEAEMADANIAAGTKTTESEMEETEPGTEIVAVDKQVVLFVGDPIYEEGEETAKSYYVKLSDSSEIHTMSADTLADWLGGRYTDYVDKYVSQVPKTALKALTVTYEGKSYVLTIDSEAQIVEESETEADTEGDDIADLGLGTEAMEPETEIIYHYLVNGKEADETDFLAFYGEAVGMYAQTILEDADVSGAPDIVLRFEKTDGTTATAEYYPGSDGMYTVKRGDGFCAKVNKLEAAEMIDAFQTLLS